MIKIIIVDDMDAARYAGVNSFVYKNAGLEHLLYVIRCTITGRAFIPAHAMRVQAAD